MNLQNPPWCDLCGLSCWAALGSRGPCLSFDWVLFNEDRNWGSLWSMTSHALAHDKTPRCEIWSSRRRVLCCHHGFSLQCREIQSLERWARVPLQNLAMKFFPEISPVCCAQSREFRAEVFFECPSKTSPKTSLKTSPQNSKKKRKPQLRR